MTSILTPEHFECALVFSRPSLYFAGTLMPGAASPSA
jgi:hypothetical protein